MQDQRSQSKYSAGSKLRIRNGGANYVNKRVTVYESNVFSTVVLIWNTVNT